MLLTEEQLTAPRYMDAAPIGRNSASTPATYTGALDVKRKLYAATDEARERGRSAGHFSYHTKAGQCPGCQGLPGLPMRCGTRNGDRYNAQTLQVVRDGLNIGEVLRLTVDEAAEHFAEQCAVHRPSNSLREVGLGYLTLGEATPSLSGGEAQRMRLSTALHTDKPGTDSVLYVFDEPSVGLHPKDIATLDPGALRPRLPPRWRRRRASGCGEAAVDYCFCVRWTMPASARRPPRVVPRPRATSISRTCAAYPAASGMPKARWRMLR